MVLVALAVAFSLLGDQALYAVLPVHFSELGLPPFQVGVLLSVNRWVRLATNHFAERASLRIGATRVLVLALLFGALTTYAYAVVSVFAVLVLARAVWGCCWSGLRHVGVMTSVESSSGDDLGRAMGYYSWISRTGSIAGCFLGALLFDTLGFRTAFILLGAGTLVGIPLGIRGRHGLGGTPSTFARAGSDNHARGIRGLLFCGFVAGCAGPGLVTSTLGFVIRERFEAPVSDGAIVIGAATLNGLLLGSRYMMNTIGAPVLGAVLDRIGRRRGGLFFFCTAPVALLLAAFCPGLVLPMMWVLVFFVCSTGILVLLPTETGRRGSRAYAAYANALDLGAATGPILGWTLLQFIALPTISFAVAGVLYAVAAGVLLKFPLDDEHARIARAKGGENSSGKS